MRLPPISPFKMSDRFEGPSYLLPARERGGRSCRRGLVSFGLNRPADLGRGLPGLSPVHASCNGQSGMGPLGLIPPPLLTRLWIPGALSLVGTVVAQPHEHLLLAEHSPYDSTFSD
jgi:hypothetical protein